jgi:hypothetical protein
MPKTDRSALNLYRMKKKAIAAHKIRRVFQSLAVK